MRGGGEWDEEEGMGRRQGVSTVKSVCMWHMYITRERAGLTLRLAHEP